MREEARDGAVSGSAKERYKALEAKSAEFDRRVKAALGRAGDATEKVRQAARRRAAA